MSELIRKPMRIAESNINGTAEGDQSLESATQTERRKLSSNHMSRRTFAGLFFGMGFTFHKAIRKAGVTPTAASDEIRRIAYDAWVQKTGRVA